MPCSTFRFLLDHANPKGDGFDMMPALPFTAIFLALGATVVNAILFMAVLSSYATRCATGRKKACRFQFPTRR